MSLYDSDKIDLFSIRNNEFAVCTLTEADDWADESNHLMLLQTKLNAYIAFIESRQIFEQANAIGKKPLISIVFKHNPSEKAKQFLKQAEDVITNAGWLLEYEVFNGN
jgi:hypothetical protein